MSFQFLQPSTWFSRNQRSSSGHTFSASNLANWFKWFQQYKSGKFGVTVTPRNAEGFGAVFACLDYKARSISAQPLKLYSRDGEYNRIDKDHPWNRIIRGRANDYMLFRQWIYWLVYNMDLWGWAVNKRLYNTRGQIVGYEPWEPRFCSDPYQKDGRWWIANTDTKEAIPYDELLIFAEHFDYKKKKGRSRISIAADSLALPMSAEKFGREFFKKGTYLSGTLTYPQKLTKEEAETRLKFWKKNYAGEENVAKVALMDGGGEFKRANMPMNDAQYVEQRRLGIVEVCMIMNVEPIKVKDHSRSTFSNIIELNTSSVIDSLLPLATYIQEVLDREIEMQYDLDFDSMFHRFNFKAMLQGNPEQQAKLIETNMKYGIWDEDDARKIQDMNPKGNARQRVPMNYMPIDRVDEYIDAKIASLYKGAEDTDSDTSKSENDEE